MTDTLNNGRNIHMALEAAEMDRGNVWPLSNGDPTFDNSTDYWRWTVTNKVLEVTYNFFAAYRVPEYYGTDPGAFEDKHNAWCIVEDAGNNTHSAAPVLFTALLVTAIDRWEKLAVALSAGLLTALFAGLPNRSGLLLGALLGVLLGLLLEARRRS